MKVWVCVKNEGSERGLDFSQCFEILLDFDALLFENIHIHTLFSNFIFLLLDWNTLVFFCNFF